MNVFVDEKNVRVIATAENILKFRGKRRQPAFPGCKNAVIEAYAFLTLIDNSQHTLRKAEAERFLEWAEGS